MSEPEERFELLRPLHARSAGAALWLARERATGRAMLVKRLLALHDDAEDARAALEAEARYGARLDPAHPHVIAVTAHGLDAARRPWLARPWIEGASLATLLEAGWRPSAAHAARLVADAALGVAHLHERCGAMHGDLAPDNLLLGTDGRVRVIDPALGTPFGQVVAGARGRARYRAPELERPGACASASADVYALGVVLEALLARCDTAPDAALRELTASARGELPEARPRDAAALAAQLAAHTIWPCPHPCPGTATPPAWGRSTDCSLWA